MSDNLSQVWDSFFAQRIKPLQIRFNGTYRAVVVETNDPLRMRRVRFKMPELHDWDLKPDDCPWAVPAYDLGTKRCGRFSYPCIGDHIWITFEKNHPYGPIYTGFADPTRRKFYALPSLYGKTQIPVDQNSNVTQPPDDYDEAYLPKDERPMSHGWQDRYGSLDIHNATGFFPAEHAEKTPPPDADPLTKSDFKQSQHIPESNNPDSKMMCRLTKYGMLILQADMGYVWKKEGGLGEFEGDFDNDEEFEIARWKYMQRVLHEDNPTGHDQRRIMQLTRYGHKFEMRDVGWNKTREGEFSSDVRIIGDGDDQRWVKMRTKGGHLIQLCDVGSDPEEDEFIKRLLIDEAKEPNLDDEDKFGDDARFIRFVTRSGIKIALDDRTSDNKKAQNPDLKNTDIGIGVLVKGRATPGTIADPYSEQSGNPIGYYWQFDERPDRNSTTWGTPMGQLMEMDDNEEFLAICSRLPSFPSSWKNLEDNEFLESSAEGQNLASSTHHLILDHGREAIRLKSRAGSGDPSRTQKLGAAASGEHAGIEIHDAPEDNPWTEIVDIDKRGIWFSRQESVGIWRAKDGSNIHIWLDDNDNNIVLHNAESSGKVQIYCAGNVEIISDKVVGLRGNAIEMSGNQIRMDAGGTNYTFGPDALRTNGSIHATNVFARLPNAERPAVVSGRGIGEASGGGDPVSNLQVEALPGKVEPENRL